MKKSLITILFLAIPALFFVAPKSFAATVCQPIYGGGQSCVQTGNVLINKTVADPKSGSFVDNLGINDNKFGAEQQITFQINVTNTGTAVIPTLTVKDILPRFVDFVAGAGNFDAGSKTLSFKVDNLNPNESRVFTITGKIASADKLPDQTIDCEVNQAIATIDSGVVGQDNSQFCIQKQVITQVPSITKGGLKVFTPQQVTTTPSTGPEMLPLLALIPTGLAGIFLKRKKI